MRFDRAALRRARKKADLTQEQLATKAGATFSTISRLERGTLKGEPTLETITKLALALEMDVDELLIIDRNGAAA